MKTMLKCGNKFWTLKMLKCGNKFWTAPLLNPAERGSLLLLEKDLVEDLEGVYLKFCVYPCAVS